MPSSFVIANAMNAFIPQLLQHLGIRHEDCIDIAVVISALSRRWMIVIHIVVSISMVNVHICVCGNQRGLLSILHGKLCIFRSLFRTVT